MKNHPSLTRLFSHIAPLVLLAAAAHGQLISNGDFSAQPVGTQVQLPAPGGVDSSTFTDWRLYNVAPAIGFTATIISGGTTLDGQAMRLDLNNTGGAPTAWALDRDNAKLPVQFAESYNLTFDAAYIGGSDALRIAIAEYDLNNNFVGVETVYNFNITDTNYLTYSALNWTPINAATTQVNIIFTPISSGVSAMSFDNVQFGAVPEPGTVALASLGLVVLLYRGRKFASRNS